MKIMTGKGSALISAAVLSLLIQANHCIYAQNADFQEQKVGHVYHVSIPDYMTKSYSLNNAASLQYLNAAKETYLIVIEDSKEQLVEAGIPFSGPGDFFEHFVASFADKSSEISPRQNLKINGNQAVQAEITKPFGGYSVH
jgi:hypothetical protein